MRLLNTQSLLLEEFFAESIPDYVILSHTWGDEEVTFQDISSPSPQTSDRAGHTKIKSCCAKAASDGYKYAWIDTCCIDKTSSAELSEAINSMYKWYSDADICYVLLEDVSTASLVRSPGFDPEALFENSRWFTRGWTLQELIAPATVEFYASDWSEIGTKSSLATQIARITGIRLAVLFGEHPSRCTVAERMSWAAQRNTTRYEDLSYCLLGLFQVHMPLLYGEGDRAFLRLQEEILKTSEDYTLFAWSEQPALSSNGGLLSHSVKYFSDCELPGGHQFSLANLASESRVSRPNPISNSNADITAQWDPPSLTSRGLRITLPLLEDEHMEGCYKAYIFCSQKAVKSGKSTTLPVCVDLRVQSPDMRVFRRMRPRYKDSDRSCLSLATWDEMSRFEWMTIYVAEQPYGQLQQRLNVPLFKRSVTFTMLLPPNVDFPVHVLRSLPPRDNTSDWVGDVYYAANGTLSMVLQIGNDLLLLLVACSWSSTNWSHTRGCCKLLDRGTVDDLEDFGERINSDHYEAQVDSVWPDRLVVRLELEDREMRLAVRQTPRMPLVAATAASSEALSRPPTCSSLTISISVVEGAGVTTKVP